MSVDAAFFDAWWSGSLKIGSAWPFVSIVSDLNSTFQWLENGNLLTETLPRSLHGREDFDGIICGAPAMDYTGLVATFFAWFGAVEKALDCIECGECLEKCPQNIEISERMLEIAKELSKKE